MYFPGWLHLVIIKHYLKQTFDNKRFFVAPNSLDFIFLLFIFRSPLSLSLSLSLVFCMYW